MVAVFSNDLGIKSKCDSLFSVYEILLLVVIKGMDNIEIFCNELYRSLKHGDWQSASKRREFTFGGKMARVKSTAIRITDKA